jgi:hypothetical protein
VARHLRGHHSGSPTTPVSISGFRCAARFLPLSWGGPVQSWVFGREGEFVGLGVSVVGVELQVYPSRSTEYPRVCTEVVKESHPDDDSTGDVVVKIYILPPSQHGNSGVQNTKPVTGEMSPFGVCSAFRPLRPLRHRSHHFQQNNHVSRVGARSCQCKPASETTPSSNPCDGKDGEQPQIVGIQIRFSPGSVLARNR